MFQRREAFVTLRLKFYDAKISNDLMRCGFGKEIDDGNPDDDKTDADQGRQVGDLLIDKGPCDGNQHNANA